MFSPSRTTKKRVLTASWLLLYAVAGLIVHAPFGHVHHHPHGEGTVHADGAAAVEHLHVGHAHSHHAHEEDHPHADDLAQAADDSKNDPTAPVHDDDCAGCQLLGSVSAPTPVLEFVQVERLKLAAPVLVVSIHAADLIGVSLARAPPATV